jgi:NAD-dependent SIR2 family protein deacetylase
LINYYKNNAALECADLKCHNHSQDYDTFFREEYMEKEKINTLVSECDMLLIGIGSGFGKHPVVDPEKIDLAAGKILYEKIRGDEYNETIDIYNQLYAKAQKKNFFILDTNCDGLIGLSQINPDRFVAPCGSLMRVQCECDKEAGVHDAQPIYSQEDISISACPVCKKKYLPNIHGVEHYNESAYLKQWNFYNKWLSGSLNKKLVILELGSDFRYASLMRWPFEKVTLINQKAELIRVNEKFPQTTPELKEKTISLQMKPEEFVEDILL